MGTGDRQGRSRMMYQRVGWAQDCHDVDVEE